MILLQAQRVFGHSKEVEDEKYPEIPMVILVGCLVCSRYYTDTGY